MFTTHFKMTTHPFLESTPTDRILKDQRITEGLARLEYLAAAGTVALVTGPTGVGKSSLIKLFLSSLSRNRYHPVYVYLTNVGATGLLKLIVSTLGEAPNAAKNASSYRSSRVPGRPSQLRYWSWTRPTLSSPKRLPICACWSAPSSTTGRR